MIDIYTKTVQNNKYHYGVWVDDTLFACEIKGQGRSKMARWNGLELYVPTPVEGVLNDHFGRGWRESAELWGRGTQPFANEHCVKHTADTQVQVQSW